MPVSLQPPCHHSGPGHHRLRARSSLLTSVPGGSQPYTPADPSPEGDGRILSKIRQFMSLKSKSETRPGKRSGRVSSA